MISNVNKSPVGNQLEHNAHQDYQFQEKNFSRTKETRDFTNLQHYSPKEAQYVWFNQESGTNKLNITQNTVQQKYFVKKNPGMSTNNYMTENPAIIPTESLIILKRILEKLISSYLKQTIAHENKMFLPVFSFQNCEAYPDLNLEAESTKITEIIDRIQLQYFEKRELKDFLSQHQSLKLFLDESVSNGFEQINNQFVWILKLFVKLLKQIQNQKEQYISLASISAVYSEELKKGQKSSISDYQMKISQKETYLKKYLDEQQFSDKAFYEENVKLLNFKTKQFHNVSENKLKSLFMRFIRFYSHLLIKLICIDIANVPSSEEDFDLGYGNEDRNVCPSNHSAVYYKQSDVTKKWFTSAFPVKSFSSINSLTSINLNNLTNIKLFNSAVDMWSQNEDNEEFDEKYWEQPLCNIQDNIQKYGAKCKKKLKSQKQQQ